MTIELDHLVVGAATLEQGVAYVEQRLGVRCQPGGIHPGMGTHNALVRLDSTTYLEVIAIDPGAEAPSEPRWFGLDDPAIRRILRETPCLLTWVARCADLNGALAATRHDAGRPRPMQRGALHWRIAFPDDGGLVEYGLVPPLIEWGPDTENPAGRLPDQGLSMERLSAIHPQPARVRMALAPLGLDGVLAINAADTELEAGLRAEIRTPAGVQRLG